MQHKLYVYLFNIYIRSGIQRFANGALVDRRDWGLGHQRLYKEGTGSQGDGLIAGIGHLLLVAVWIARKVVVRLYVLLRRKFVDSVVGTEWVHSL